MLARRDARAWLAALILVALLIVSAGAVRAKLLLDGAGGCGQFAESVAAAAPGDVLVPMRGGVNTESVVISRTLVIQGGWVPATGDCTSSGTDEFDSAAALIAAGFAFDPSQRSDLFGDGVAAILPIDLRSGQTLALQNLQASFQSVNRDGIAVSGVISGGARLRLENLRFENLQAGNGGSGGAVYLEVRGGSQLVIAGSSFIGGNAFGGGAVEVRLYDGSSLLVEGSSFSGNEALTGNGGALRVLVERGSVTLRGNSFSDNRAINGQGPAVAIERAPGASGTATAVLSGNSFDGGAGDLFVSGVAQLSPQLYMPALQGNSGSGLRVQIRSIALSDAVYQVSFTTAGFTPQLPGRHVHFFFDTVPPGRAGAPASGPWFVYGGPSPFRGYDIVDRPPGATRLCALVANPDHSVIQGTGGCVSLP